MGGARQGCHTPPIVEVLQTPASLSPRRGALSRASVLAGACAVSQRGWRSSRDSAPGERCSGERAASICFNNWTGNVCIPSRCNFLTFLFNSIFFGVGGGFIGRLTVVRNFFLRKTVCVTFGLRLKLISAVWMSDFLRVTFVLIRLGGPRVCFNLRLLLFEGGCNAN